MSTGQCDPIDEPAECAGETEQQSPFSPGVVADCEPIARVVYLPQHRGPDGLPAPGLLPSQDLLDAKRRGLSTIRVSGMTGAECDRIVRERVLRSNSKSHDGLAVVSCRAVRDQQDCQCERLWCVIDAGEDGFESHALIQLAARHEFTRSSVKKVRGELLSLFKYWPDLEYFRGESSTSGAGRSS